MLKNQWQSEVSFQIGAVNDREPVAEDDELVVLAAPDPQSARALVRRPRQPWLAQDRRLPFAGRNKINMQAQRRKCSRHAWPDAAQTGESLAQPWQQRHATGML
jgi:hypothetical protein